MGAGASWRSLGLKTAGAHSTKSRHVSRSENLGGRAVLGGDNVPPLVEIGLTDLPKTGGAKAPPPACDSPG